MSGPATDKLTSLLKLLNEQPKRLGRVLRDQFLTGAKAVTLADVTPERVQRYTHLVDTACQRTEPNTLAGNLARILEVACKTAQGKVSVAHNLLSFIDERTLTLEKPLLAQVQQIVAQREAKLRKHRAYCDDSRSRWGGTHHGFTL